LVMAITAIAFMPKQVDASIEMVVENPVQRVRVNSWRAAPNQDPFIPALLFDGNTAARAWHTNHNVGAGTDDNASHGQGNGWHPTHVDNLASDLVSRWSPTMDIDLGSQQTVTSITFWRNTNNEANNHRHNIYSVNVLSHASTANTWPNGERTYAGQVANPADVNVPMEDIEADFAATGWSAVAGATVAGLVPKGDRALTQEITITFAQPLNTRYIRLEIDAWNSNRDGFPDGAPDHVMMTQLLVTLATPVMVPAPVTVPLGSNVPARHRVSSWHAHGTGSDETVYGVLFDGSAASYLHSNWGGGSGDYGGGADWFYVDVDMGEVVNILTSIELQRRTGGAGTIRDVQIFTHAERGNTFPNGERTFAVFQSAPAAATMPSQADLDADFATTGWQRVNAVTVTGLASEGAHRDFAGQLVTIDFTATVESRYFRIAINTAGGGGGGDLTEGNGHLELAQVRLVSGTPVARFFIDQNWYIDNSTGEGVWRPTIAPFITPANHSMLPLAAIAAAVGGTPNWVPATRTAEVTMPDGRKISVDIDDRLYGADGTFMGTAQIVTVAGEARTFVPARFVIEALGLRPVWLDTASHGRIRGFDIFTE
jgi:hypothetical protein